MYKSTVLTSKTQENCNKNDKKNIISSVYIDIDFTNKENLTKLPLCSTTQSKNFRITKFNTKESDNLQSPKRSCSKLKKVKFNNIIIIVKID